MKQKEDIEPINEHNQKHGLCIYYWYYDNGNIMYKKRYVNGIKHGIGERYLVSGKIWLKKYWNNSKLVYRESYGIINRIRFDI